ncbi:transglutaminase family protein [Nocardia sp. NPDC058640]|uniref:transglutaminase family protein n=1 Tax=Nocardia sp. NPDC058640 TaxID=3346571 RepID=UPI0036582890
MGIKVSLEHRTAYSFDRLVEVHPHEVRLRPAPHSRTPIEAYSLEVSPADHFVNWQQDAFGNFVARLVFPTPTKELSITVGLIADLEVVNPFDFFIEDYAEFIPFEYDAALAEDLAPYLRRVDEDGPGSGPGELLQDWARVHRPQGRIRAIDYLVELNYALRNSVDYTVRMEAGVQTPDHTLRTALGSCRDSAWLLVGVLRELGLAARFVSGYLVQLTSDVPSLDGPSGPTADFTDLHAWTEVYLPGAGWVGMDPTSGLFAGEGHIPLAATPHPGAAAPITGATGITEATLDFSNVVRRIHEDPRVTLPYTESQWERIVASGAAIDARMAAADVGLTMGGEPTFVSIDDQVSAQWTTDADGAHKRERAVDLSDRLRSIYAPTGIVQYRQGKWYPGEPLPRWEIAIAWRADGEPIWTRQDLLADPWTPVARSVARSNGYAPAGAEVASAVVALGLADDGDDSVDEQQWASDSVSVLDAPRSAAVDRVSAGPVDMVAVFDARRRVGGGEVAAAVVALGLADDGETQGVGGDVLEMVDPGGVGDVAGAVIALGLAGGADAPGEMFGAVAGPTLPDQGAVAAAVVTMGLADADDRSAGFQPADELADVGDRTESAVEADYLADAPDSGVELVEFEDAPVLIDEPVGLVEAEHRRPTEAQQACADAGGSVRPAKKSKVSEKADKKAKSAARKGLGKKKLRGKKAKAAAKEAAAKGVRATESPQQNSAAGVIPDRAPAADIDAARALIAEIAGTLGLPEGQVRPAFEDPLARLAATVSAPYGDPPVADIDPTEDSPEVRRVLLETLEESVDRPSAYVLPIHRRADGAGWASADWQLRRGRSEDGPGRIVLADGDSPAGLRLPIGSVSWHAPPVLPDSDPLYQKPLSDKRSEPPAAVEPADFTPTTALVAEVRQGRLHVFLPPVTELDDFLDLIAKVEAAAVAIGQPVVLEGYAPPSDARLHTFSVTPDPGVIEVNIMPTSSFAEQAQVLNTLYEQARLARLSTESFDVDGTHGGTGGGNHITLGGVTPARSPMLRRPDLLVSMLTYWQRHPALSYLFSGRFIGPTSQAPRADEGREDALYELEIAFAEVARLSAEQSDGSTPSEIRSAPWHIDRALRHLLTDLTGNTHRAEFCIDKLYSPDSARGRLGLLELRGFEMPPHFQMAMVQSLLVRGLVAMFWDKPLRAPLIRHGANLHGRYLLPHFLMNDIAEVAADLRAAGVDFDTAWLDPFTEFRFPRIGTAMIGEAELELRGAIEPWLTLGEQTTGQGTARYVDSSVERLQVRLVGADRGRYVLTCNGMPVPLLATDKSDVQVAGVRYRAWQPPNSLHPTITVDAPLVFDLVDVATGISRGGATYHVVHPGGRAYDDAPVNAVAAQSRRNRRFEAAGHTVNPMDPAELRAKIAAQSTDVGAPGILDLRRARTVWGR